MAPPNNKSIKNLITPFLVVFVDKGMKWLSSSLLRIFIVTLAIGITTYLLYVKVWNPLLSDVVLPDGISTKNIKLNTELLKNINEQRISRIEHKSQFFSLYNLIRPNNDQPK